MSVPMKCETCGTMIGIREAAPWERGRFVSRVRMRCPGLGKHSMPTVTATRGLFGLVKRVTKFYPETKTTSHWIEYTGPKNKLVFWFVARLCGSRLPLVTN